MRVHLDRKQWAILLATLLIAILLLVILYTSIYKPAKVRTEQQEAALDSERKLLAIVEERLTNTDEDTFESTLSLQKRIPVKPLTDQFILDLGKAETISGVAIQEINFTKESVIAPDEPEEVEGDEEDAVDPKLPPVAPPALPVGMEQISAAVTVVADDYLDFEDFLRIIESQVRIVQVNEVVINGVEERMAVDEEPSKPTFEVIISAYYLPVLEDLLNQLPQVDAPAPSGKEDPLNRLPKTESTDEN